MAYANLLKLFLYKKYIPLQIDKFQQNTIQKFTNLNIKRLHKFFILLLNQKYLFYFYNVENQKLWK